MQNILIYCAMIIKKVLVVNLRFRLLFRARQSSITPNLYLIAFMPLALQASNFSFGF